MHAEPSPERGKSGSRRLLAWLWDDAPLWLAWAQPVVAWIGCRRHGHEPFVEMDNRTVVCAYCARVLDA